MSDCVGVILAGGRGKRMGALGDEYPKPLLPVGNRPLILHHLEALRTAGIEEVYIIVGYGADRIEQVVGDGSRYRLRVRYVDQGTVLGSAHALAQVAPLVSSPFLLLLGDYFFSPPDLRPFLRRLAVGESAMAAMPEPDGRLLREACSLETDAGGRVLAIVEKPAVPRSNLKGCGVYALRPEAFDAVRRTPRTALRDEYELSVSIELYLRAGFPFYAERSIVWDFNFTRPEDVLNCNLKWLKEHGLNELVGQDVRMAEGTRLERVIAGDRSAVTEPSRLEEVVLFPEAWISTACTLQRALVTPTARIACSV